MLIVNLDTAGLSNQRERRVPREEPKHPLIWGQPADLLRLHHVKNIFVNLHKYYLHKFSSFPKFVQFLCGVDLCGVVNGSSGEKQSGDKSPDYPIFISHFQGNKTQNRYYKIIRKSKWGRVSGLSDLYFSFPRKKRNFLSRSFIHSKKSFTVHMGTNSYDYTLLPFS